MRENNKVSIMIHITSCFLTQACLHPLGHKMATSDKVEEEMPSLIRHDGSLIGFEYRDDISLALTHCTEQEFGRTYFALHDAILHHSSFLLSGDLMMLIQKIFILHTPITSAKWLIMAINVKRRGWGRVRPEDAHSRISRRVLQACVVTDVWSWDVHGELVQLTSTST